MRTRSAQNKFLRAAHWRQNLHLHSYGSTPTASQYQKFIKHLMVSDKFLVPRAGVEPAAFSLGGRRSILLSYRGILISIAQKL